MGNVPLVGVNKTRLTAVDRFFKLVLDYTLVFAAAPFVLVLLLIIALLIKHGSGKQHFGFNTH